MTVYGLKTLDQSYIPGIRVIVYFPPNLVASKMSDCTVAKPRLFDQCTRSLEKHSEWETHPFVDEAQQVDAHEGLGCVPRTGDR